MAFLSDKTIKENFSRFFGCELKNGDEEAIQPSSVDLHLGSEAFLSGEKELVRLSPGKPEVIIKPGDFAMLLTKEKIQIPKDMMAFISIKSKFKFMGLVNISGFHVDPGYRGHLIFAVYNAGPRDIVLRKDSKLFTIFFASLDEEAGTEYSGNRQGQSHISSDNMNMLTGKSVSPYDLEGRLAKLEATTNLQWGLLVSAGVGLLLLAIKTFGQ